MNKHIIGIGCSWTQGEGAYPEHIWKECNGRAQIRHKPDESRRAYEHEYSWVNVLCKEHFADHTPINLGVRGIGNRAAVKQLYFCDTVDWDNSTGYIVLMLSGFERQDFFNKTPTGENNENHYDGYSSIGYRHYKWRTMWPFPDHGGAEEPLWRIYGTMLWSEQFVASETMMALLELQAFCKAHNYKMIVANAFNQHFPLGSDNYLKQYTTEKLHSKFDWSSYLHTQTDYVAMVQKLVQLDGIIKPEDWGSFYGAYEKLDWPATYITNDVHPTIEGYRVIASELAKFMKAR
jgi:hypothetical protein